MRWYRRIFSLSLYVKWLAQRNMCLNCIRKLRDITIGVKETAGTERSRLDLADCKSAAVSSYLFPCTHYWFINSLISNRSRKIFPFIRLIERVYNIYRPRINTYFAATKIYRWHDKTHYFQRVKKKDRRLRANEFVVLHRDLSNEISPPGARVRGAVLIRF